MKMAGRMVLKDVPQVAPVHVPVDVDVASQARFEGGHPVP